MDVSSNGAKHIMNQSATLENIHRLQAECEALRAQVAALGQSVEYWKHLAVDQLDQLPVMVHLVDAEGRIVQVNRAWTACLGYQPQEVQGRSSMDFLSEDSRRYAEEIVGPNLIRTGSCREVQFQFISKSGQPVDVLFSAQCEVDAQGQFQGARAVLVDVTNWKRAEEIRRESERTLHKLTEAVPGAVFQFRVEPDGTRSFPLLSRNGVKLFGCTKEELNAQMELGRSMALAEDQAGLENSIAESARLLSDWSYDFRIRHPDGQIRWIRGTSAPEVEDDGSILWHGVFFDITERKVAAQQQREQQSIFQTFCDSSPFNMGVVELMENDIRLLWVNKVTLDALQITREELCRDPQSRNRFISQDVDFWLGKYREAHRQGEPIEFLHFDERHQVWLHATIAPIPAEEGQPLRCCYIVQTMPQRDLRPHTLTNGALSNGARK